MKMSYDFRYIDLFDQFKQNNKMKKNAVNGKKFQRSGNCETNQARLLSESVDRF